MFKNISDLLPQGHPSLIWACLKISYTPILCFFGKLNMGNDDQPSKLGDLNPLTMAISTTAV